jgi:hypothetical protein
MAKILSFEVTDEFYERVVAQQQRAHFTYLSPFLRSLVEDGVLALERKSSEGTDNG